MGNSFAHIGQERAPGEPRSTLVNRNVTVAGHRTSVRLEPEMWAALKQVCARERMTLHEIVTLVGRGRGQSSLTAALRVHLLIYFQAAATDEGHRRAGHGVPARRLPVELLAAQPPI
ncbi:MAG TPA: ribbon-helix-helix domain-containing protein [Stellaceae bacterium]|nr:ribbon-helix-helix domain-containing protein [Stellaceae bacterium]